ncbi:uncharacterized protein LOC141610988 isoform X3 [Silene latifolia]|uniref:uncharacterized protein LOC141610988 isoform X3 n=1 Tax=Silene latifolia TaxID=37657 RepID=UPI003D78999F
MTRRKHIVPKEWSWKFTATKNKLTTTKSIQIQIKSRFKLLRSELDDLHNTIETVKAVLMDADAKQDSLNFQEKNYIQELKDAVYDADDVLDEFVTLAKRKQLRSNKTCVVLRLSWHVNKMPWLCEDVEVEETRYARKLSVFDQDFEISHNCKNGNFHLMGELSSIWFLTKIREFLRAARMEAFILWDT